MLSLSSFSVFWPKMDVQPPNCVSRRSMKLETCMETVEKMCWGGTGAVRTGEDTKLQKDHLATFVVIKSLHYSSLIISFRDAKCGKIQCLTSASKPTENNAVRIDTTVSLGTLTIQCIGTHVYKAGQVDEDTQGDTLDPGLVMTGTKCGVDSVRHKRV